MTSLRQWALIDIETTGVDPNYDQIIDLGFLQFDGTKLVKKYSSLVRTEVRLSKFIEKLTGISQEMVNNAPLWSKVEQDLLDLDGHALIAHNAQFEEMFLKKYFVAYNVENSKLGIGKNSGATGYSTICQSK